MTSQTNFRSQDMPGRAPVTMPQVEEPVLEAEVVVSAGIPEDVDPTLVLVAVGDEAVVEPSEVEELTVEDVSDGQEADVDADAAQEATVVVQEPQGAPDASGE